MEDWSRAIKRRASFVAVVVSASILLLFGVHDLNAQEKKGDKQKEAAEWIAKAADALNLRGPGSSPFRLRAKVRLLDIAAGHVDGVYALVWMSEGKWREEISFPGYEELRVAAQNKLWVRRSVDFVPLRIHQLKTVLRLTGTLGLNKGDSIRRFIEEDKNRHGWLCAYVGSRGIEWREYCFERDSLRLAQYAERGMQSVRAWQFSDYSLFGARRFPRRIQFVNEGRPAFEVQIEELSAQPEVNADDFAPPDAARAFDWCEGMTAASLEDSALIKDFELPVEFSVSLYAIVEGNGTLSGIQVLESTRPQLNDLLVSKLVKSRHRPASCNGKPIRSEGVFGFGRVILSNVTPRFP